MYCEGDIIQINDDYRLKVVLDDSSEDPREWGWDTDILTIDSYRIWKGWEEPQEDVAKAASEFHYRVRRGRWTTEQRDRAIHLYKMLLEDNRAFEVREFRGYSPSDWATHLVLWDDKKGSNVYDAFEAWLKGDVYGVVAQKKVVWSAEGHDDEFDWEDVDSLWGCYLDEEYTPEMVASEHFESYPEDEEASE